MSGKIKFYDQSVIDKRFVFRILTLHINIRNVGRSFRVIIISKFLNLVISEIQFLYLILYPKIF